jgi:hypothetical protein
LLAAITVALAVTKAIDEGQATRCDVQGIALSQLRTYQAKVAEDW